LGFLFSWWPINLKVRKFPKLEEGILVLFLFFKIPLEVPLNFNSWLNHSSKGWV